MGFKPTASPILLSWFLGGLYQAVLRDYLWFCIQTTPSGVWMPKWDAVKCSVFFGLVNPFSSLKLSFGELVKSRRYLSDKLKRNGTSPHGFWEQQLWAPMGWTGLESPQAQSWGKGLSVC